MRINVGCGQTPVTGWRNFDNSFSIFLSKIPILPKLLYSLKFLNNSQYQMILFAKSNHIERGDVTKGLPLKTGSVEVLYSSHMLEHLDPTEAKLFMKEARRVLQPSGIFRLAVPDIKKQVKNYMKKGDADSFVFETLLTQSRPNTFVEIINMLFIGPRNHLWMYDGNSLTQLLKNNGFVNVKIVPPGKTRIPNPKPLNLSERATESVFVEAANPPITKK